MSIRVRLLISYLAMVLVPIFFVLVSALLVVFLFRGDIKELKNIYLPPEQHQTFSKKDQLFIEVQRQALRNPNQFANQAYLKNIDGLLKKSGDKAIVVRKGEKVIYRSPTLNGLEEGELPTFGLYGDIDPIEKINHQFVSIKKIDFVFPDNTEGSLFFVSNANGFAKFVRSSFPLLFIGLIIILIVTNGLLTYFVSKSIIRPIQELQKAAKMMKEGNLDVPIKPASKDEMGQLAQGFDEMRIRLRESIEKLLAYEENRKELIANISHDLKTPITAIKGYVEGIRDGVANSPEKMERYIQTIYTKSMDLDHLIDQLFLYSKLDLQNLPFHFERFPFHHYLEDLIEELRFDLEEKNVEIKLNINPQGKYLIKGDREYLKRVIHNIVENSLKYNDSKNKQLIFHLAEKESTVLFSMADNGPGISRESLPFIFDRFYRADMARGTEKGGSGLGLSIAKRIIEEHQGWIWAESELGEGTTILFTLRKADDKNEKNINY